MAAAWVSANPERRKEYRASRYEEHKVIGKRWRQRLKDRVFDAYGGYRCACCGETEPIFLAIDHMNNDGAAHRKSGAGKGLYHWLERQGYPAGFQVLCHNCNIGKHINGGVCPHQQEKGQHNE